MNNPSVSVLIPFKNTEAYLQQCIEAILAQTYEYWEVLAVDDGSIDTSRRIMDDYSKADKRIHVFTNTGQGIIDALRLAYAKSNGTYITRMDSDDIMTPNRLEVMLSALQKKGLGSIAIGQVKYFAANGIKDGYARYEQWLNGLTQEGRNYDDIYKECVIPSPCWMVHRKDLDKCGAFMPNRYPEDYDLAFRFYEHNVQCIPCQEVLHYWRDYDNRASRTSEHYAQNYFLDLKVDYFLKLDFTKTKTLVLWGAGRKGKEIAKSLQNHGIAFEWLCNNPKKIGKHIYTKELLHTSTLEAIANPQCIIAVANEEEQHSIRTYLSTIGLHSPKDVFFFC